MMVIFLLGISFMFSRVYKNLICTAALISKMSEASLYSCAHSRSAFAEMIWLSTARLVLETALRLLLSREDMRMSLRMICSMWTPQLSELFSTYCAIFSLTYMRFISRSCST